MSPTRVLLEVCFCLSPYGLLLSLLLLPLSLPGSKVEVNALNLRTLLYKANTKANFLWQETCLQFLQPEIYDGPQTEEIAGTSNGGIKTFPLYQASVYSMKYLYSLFIIICFQANSRRLFGAIQNVLVRHIYVPRGTIGSPGCGSYIVIKYLCSASGQVSIWQHKDLSLLPIYLGQQAKYDWLYIGRHVFEASEWQRLSFDVNLPVYPGRLFSPHSNPTRSNAT